jgi:membrane-associated phospholipid phosphatase
MEKLWGASPLFIGAVRVWQSREKTRECLLMACAVTAAVLCKFLVKAERPMAGESSIPSAILRHVPKSGFPSSHAFVFGSFSVGQRVPEKVFLGILALSRVYYRKHYLYQVAAGFLAGALFRHLLFVFEGPLFCCRWRRPCA